MPIDIKGPEWTEGLLKSKSPTEFLKENKGKAFTALEIHEAVGGHIENVLYALVTSSRSSHFCGGENRQTVERKLCPENVEPEKQKYYYTWIGDKKK